MLDEAIKLMQEQDDHLVAGLVKRRELPILEEVKRLRDAHRITWPNSPLHQGTKEMETGHLLLRKFKEEDANTMYANWAGSKTITEFLEWPAHADASVTKSVLATWAKKYGDPTFYQWAIVDKSIGEVVGSISVIHSDFDVLELGFALSEKVWHKGYVIESLKVLFDYFFNCVGVKKVWGKTDVINLRAINSMKNAGMKFVETIPHGGFNQRGICDVDIYALTKEDFMKNS